MCRSNGRRLMVRPVVITQTTLLRSLALLLLNYHTERLSVKKSKGLGAREDEGSSGVPRTLRRTQETDDETEASRGLQGRPTGTDRLKYQWIRGWDHKQHESRREARTRKKKLMNCRFSNPS